MIFYIIGGINAENRHGELDEVAAELFIISTIGFAALSVLFGNNFGLIPYLADRSGALGFLAYSFHPDPIFMRDKSSHFPGFIVAVLAIVFTSRP